MHICVKAFILLNYLAKYQYVIYGPYRSNHKTICLFFTSIIKRWTENSTKS